MEIKWDATNEELRAITKIARRANCLAAANEIIYPYSEAIMDIEACHCNGTPLRLADLADADDANFGHDVFGIRRFLNRETGELEGFFVPRYALQERAQ
jgi:hypothetical protein